MAKAWRGQDQNLHGMRLRKAPPGTTDDMMEVSTRNSFWSNICWYLIISSLLSIANDLSLKYFINQFRHDLIILCHVLDPARLGRDHRAALTPPATPTTDLLWKSFATCSPHSASGTCRCTSVDSAPVADPLSSRF